MKLSILLLSFLTMISAGMRALAGVDENMPADTYFAMAITENSHNHYGENLLYLDFQDHPDTSKIAPRIVIAPEIQPGSITIDGKAG